MSNDSKDTVTKPTMIPTLEYLSRNVVATNLERYPPECLGILSEQAWDSLVKHRLKKTRPQQKSTGGLDGHGRLVPAISAKFMLQVEETNPHLSESGIADRYIWKDCVEHKFKRGGPSRPVCLLVPWPILVSQVQQAQSDLREEKSNAEFDKALHTLTESPMNVALLQTTGVGKTIKQCIKFYSKQSPDDSAIDVWTKRSGKLLTPLEEMQHLLQRWKQLAQSSGVSVRGGSDSGVATSPKTQECKDLTLLQPCTSWRRLYKMLLEREAVVRANQGARMREIRHNLSTSRPKIIKVRPNLKHQQMLEKRAASPKIAPSTSKLQQLRAASNAHAKKYTGNANTKPASFGAAVAFVSTSSSSSSNKKRKTTTTITLAGGRQMKLSQQQQARRGGFASLTKKKSLRK